VATPTAYHFGDYRFEPFNARLICQGRVIPLTAKAAETLRQLVEHPDTLVTKETLMSAVWPDTAVDDNNLNQQISSLRKVLGEDGATFIETVPRRGFRFVVPVQQVAYGSSVSASPAPRPESADVVARIGRSRGMWLGAVAATIVLAVVAVGAMRWREQRRIFQESDAAFERGRALYGSGDARGATEALQQAITLNPDHAQAYASLAHALNRYSSQASTPDPPKRSPSVEAAERSVVLDPECATCRGTLGLYLFAHAWQWAPAEGHLREAIRLDPGNAGIRPSYALLLVATGRASDALAQIDFALDKLPYEISWLSIRASILYSARRYDDVIRTTDRVLAINDRDRGAWEWRSKALFQLGRWEEAIQALAQVAFAEHATALERAVRDGGPPAGVRELLRVTDGWGQRSEQSWRRAPWLLLLNDTEKAFAELQIAHDTRKWNMMYLGVDPVYDSIRDHPRYRALLAGMGLAPWFGDDANGSR
jgi:DNA-binding winged helix-turn-helix (wHTH) protein/Flp pilus assembly protein TadD